MLGAIIGDIAGSIYEFQPLQGDKNNFPLISEKSFFTDDTVLTCAVAMAIMRGYGNPEKTTWHMVNMIRYYGRMYPHVGYGRKFYNWLFLDKDQQPYNSFGNGSAMRVSPIAWAYDTFADVEKYAAISAAVTHNHPEGIKGACSVAAAIFLARIGRSKDQIREYITSHYGYDLDRSLDQIKPEYRFDETCQGSVPEAIIAFLESSSFEEAIRNAIWLGGDSDTQAAIAGSIAQAFYGDIPDKIVLEARDKLDGTINTIINRWQNWFAFNAFANDKIYQGQNQSNISITEILQTYNEKK